MIQYDLLTSSHNAYTGSASANITDNYLSIDAKSPGRHYIFLKATTVGTISGLLEIEVEICGTEIIQSLPYQPDSLYLEYIQFTGQLRIQTVREHIFKSLVQVNSSHCPINWKMSEIVDSQKQAYTGELIKFDSLTEQMFVNTTNSTDF